MARQGLDHAKVVDGAAALVNARGAEALSLAELAAHFHVRTPSLYNHIEGLGGLRRDLTVRALRELQQRVASAAAGRAQRDALKAVAAAYRAWALENAGLYTFAVRSEGAGDSSIDLARVELHATLLAALRGYALSEARAQDAVRMVAATLHGFVSIELSGGFGGTEESSHSFVEVVEMLHGALLLPHQEEMRPSS